MKTIEAILTELEKQVSIDDLNNFLVKIGNDFNYHSCSIIFNENLSCLGMKVKNLGYKSEKLDCLLKEKKEPFYIEENSFIEVYKFSLHCNYFHVSKLSRLENCYIILELQSQILNQKKKATFMLWLLILPSIERQIIKAINGINQFEFTNREMECIKWVSASKTSWEISKILNISERTVNFHIQNMLKKTGALNRSHLLSMCKSYGLIA